MVESVSPDLILWYVGVFPLDALLLELEEVLLEAVALVFDGTLAVRLFLKNWELL